MFLVLSEIRRVRPSNEARTDMCSIIQLCTCGGLQNRIL